MPISLKHCWHRGIAKIQQFLLELPGRSCQHIDDYMRPGVATQALVAGLFQVCQGAWIVFLRYGSRLLQTAGPNPHANEL